VIENELAANAQQLGHDIGNAYEHQEERCNT
jgi:hypothetical protein